MVKEAKRAGDLIKDEKDRKYFQHGKHSMSFHKDDDNNIDVRVEKEIINGDTIMSVIINGEPVDASKFEEIDGKIKWISEDGEVIEIDIDER